MAHRKAFFQPKISLTFSSPDCGGSSAAGKVNGKSTRFPTFKKWIVTVDFCYFGYRMVGRNEICGWTLTTKIKELF